MKLSIKYLLVSALASVPRHATASDESGTGLLSDKGEEKPPAQVGGLRHRRDEIMIPKFFMRVHNCHDERLTACGYDLDENTYDDYSDKEKVGSDEDEVVHCYSAGGCQLSIKYGDGCKTDRMWYVGDDDGDYKVNLISYKNCEGKTKIAQGTLDTCPICAGDLLVDALGNAINEIDLSIPEPDQDCSSFEPQDGGLTHYNCPCCGVINGGGDVIGGGDHTDSWVLGQDP